MHALVGLARRRRVDATRPSEARVAVVKAGNADATKSVVGNVRVAKSATRARGATTRGATTCGATRSRADRVP